MRNLTEIQSQVHSQVLNYRRLERIVTSQAFEAVSKKVDDNVIKMIEQCDCNALEAWMKQSVAECYGEYSVRQLRIVAARLHIVNYSFMTKGELLSAITGAEREKIGDHPGT